MKIKEGVVKSIPHRPDATVVFEITLSETTDMISSYTFRCSGKVAS